MEAAIAIIISFNSSMQPSGLPTAHRDTMEHCRTIAKDDLILSRLTSLARERYPDAVKTYIICQPDRDLR